MFGLALSSTLWKWIGAALMVAGLVAAGFYVHHRIYMKGYNAAVAVYEAEAAKRALRDATRIVDATNEIHRTSVPILIRLDRMRTLPAALDTQLTEAVHAAPDYAAAVRPDAFLVLRKARLDAVRAAAAPELRE